MRVGMGLESFFATQRRLSTTPSYVDIIVIVGLSFLMLYLLKVLLQLSSKWKMRVYEISSLFFANSSFIFLEMCDAELKMS
jgi:hypothetical protein